MAKSRKLEAMLAKLTQLRDDPTSEDAIATLQQSLTSKYGVAVARAAKLVEEFKLVQLVPDLVAAFHRCLEKPVDTDPSCLAKAAIADALYRLDRREEAVFLKGIRYVQMEPVFGGQQDTAAKLRGICALGLVRMNYRDVLTELADLLADPESAARIAAARAIAYSENDAGVPLLRLRSRLGDDPEILSEYLTALLKLDPDRSLGFVNRFLSAPDPQTQELVALALGESRLSEAFDLLRNWWQRAREAQLRRTGLLAIAMLRSDLPFQFLLSLIAEGRKPDAQDAIAALSLYRQDATLWQRVRYTVEQRGDPELLEILKREERRSR